MVFYLSAVSAESQMNVSPEDMKKNMEPWTNWFKKIGSALVEAGGPLGEAVSINNKYETPPAQITGYSIIQAENIEEAKTIMEDQPFLTIIGGTIEIREILPSAM